MKTFQDYWWLFSAVLFLMPLGYVFLAERLFLKERIVTGLLLFCVSWSAATVIILIRVLMWIEGIK